MWDEAKQQRLNELQRRAACEPLPVDDQRALEKPLHELEQAEWVMVHPVLSRLSHDQEMPATDMDQLRAQNAVVAAPAERYTDLLARASAQLAELTREREALRRVYERAVR